MAKSACAPHMQGVTELPTTPRGPLEDALYDRPDLLAAASRREAEAHLEALFLEAQGQVNSYQAERLREVYDLAERAVALGSAFPVLPEEERGGAGAWFTALPSLLSRYGGGLLLAACAPFVAEDSMILAVLAGVGGAVTLAAAFREETAPRRAAKPKAADARFRSLVSAADRALSSMTAPRALAAPAGGRSSLPDEDVLGFLQDAVMAEGSEEADELRANAERLIARAGYRVVREGSPDLFETMIDPDVDAPMLLKPALVHREDSSKILFGVMVRGQSV